MRSFMLLTISLCLIGCDDGDSAGDDAGDTDCQARCTAHLSTCELGSDSIAAAACRMEICPQADAARVECVENATCDQLENSYDVVASTCGFGIDQGEDPDGSGCPQLDCPECDFEGALLVDGACVMTCDDACTPADCTTRCLQHVETCGLTAPGFEIGCQTVLCEGDISRVECFEAASCEDLQADPDPIMERCTEAQ